MDKYYYNYLKYRNIFHDKESDNNANNKTRIDRNRVPKLIIIDFDSTMTRFSVPNKLFEIRKNGYEDMISSMESIIKQVGLNNIFSELMNDKEFIDYLRNIKTLKNIHLIVASFGIKEAIKILLNKKKIKDIFDVIYTPIDLNLPEGFYHGKTLQGKNKMITKIKEDIGLKLHDNNILLIDDSGENIWWAKRRGYEVIKVDGKTGLTLANKKDIIKFIKA